MLRIRAWLCLPVYAIQGAVMLVCWLLRRLSYYCARASNGLRFHVYYPVCVARRWVAGEPLWKPIDFNLGRVPRTDAQRSAAHAEGFQSRTCDCNNASCSGFMWFPPEVDPEQVLRLHGPPSD